MSRETTRTSELLRMTPDQLTEARKLIRSTCANLIDREHCLLLDDGEPCRCPQLDAYSLLCRYFRDAVLPGDEKLYNMILGVEPKGYCVICGAPIFAKSNRAKYCPACSKKRRKTKEAARQRERYAFLRI